MPQLPLFYEDILGKEAGRELVFVTRARVRAGAREKSVRGARVLQNART